MLPNLRLYYIVGFRGTSYSPLVLSCLVSHSCFICIAQGYSCSHIFIFTISGTLFYPSTNLIFLYILLWNFPRGGGVRRYKYSNLKFCRSTNLPRAAIHMIDCCSCSGIFAPAKQTITTSTSSSSSQMSENHSDRSSNTSHLTDRLALTSLITPVQNLHIPRLAALVETQTAVPWGLSWKHKVV